jgi:deferrochelatase/peroxidase EfeB
MPTSAVAPPDSRNVQGLILRGYTHPFSCHMLFRFLHKTGAGQFINALMPYLQSAEDWGQNKPAKMLNIGLTYNSVILVDDKLKGQFPPAFMQGPASSNSQVSLYDLGASDPSKWWHKSFQTSDIHCIIHIYALTADTLSSLVTTVSQAATAGSVKELFPLADGTRRLEQYELPDETVYFGYRDGIDNPALGWPSDPAKTVPSDLNNFVIGYPGSPFEPGPTQGDAGRFAKDGCYNAFRVLYQDVQKFDKCLQDNAPGVAANTRMSVRDAADWLAAKLVGRWFDGSPLILSPDAPDPKTSTRTDFGYTGDTTGVRCPFSAHTRVANPRDEGVFIQDQPVPRLIRRGMPYGKPPEPPDYSGDRGLIGLFLCGGLAEQFELIYSWMNTNNFSALFDPNYNSQDAVLANRATPNVDSSFTIPTQEGSIKLSDLPQFIVTRGTAYCLLPSIQTLRAIAAGAG